MPEIVAMLLAVALLVSLYLGTVFLIRITGAIFSTRRRSEIRSRPLTHFLMFCMIPTSIGLVLILHPWPIKIYEVRRQAHGRIENAGGLDAIKRGCLIIANESSNREPFLWLNSKTNSPSLPTAIAALKPIQVIADAPEVSGVFVPNVRIHILGSHSTDNSWPEYWLWFVKGDVSENSLKQIGQHTGHEEIRILTNSIYELIQ